MTTLNFVRYAFGFASGIAFLAGCNANGNTPPIGGSSTAQSPVIHSWMQKPPKGTTGTLWATDSQYASVDRIAYPSGTLIGQVAGFSFPYGDCSDKSGNVYVADYNNESGYEINSSGSVINSWPTGGETIGCSVALNGDVAFTNSYPGGVKIVAGPDAGASYPGPGSDDYIAGYDRHGNLYARCSFGSRCSSASLFEWPAGGSNWTSLNVNGTLSFGNTVQNMGQYLGIGGGGGIALVQVSGSAVTVVKSIAFHGGSGCGGSVGFFGSWASINNKPDGVITKKIKDIAGGNIDCAPSPIDIYKGNSGTYIRSITPVSKEYDYGVTFTKP